MILEILAVSCACKLAKMLTYDVTKSIGSGSSDSESSGSSNGSTNSDDGGSDPSWHSAESSCSYPDTSRDFNPSEEASEAFRDVFGDDNVEKM